MGISMSTALEIFTNPCDLVFGVIEDKAKYGVIITRGPGHRFKPLVTLHPTYGDKFGAIEEIVGMLTAIRDSMNKVLSNPKDSKELLIQRIVNPNNSPLSDLCGLNQEHINLIAKALQDTGVAETNHFIATTT